MRNRSGNPAGARAILAIAVVLCGLLVVAYVARDALRPVRPGLAPRARTAAPTTQPDDVRGAAPLDRAARAESPPQPRHAAAPPAAANDHGAVVRRMLMTEFLAERGRLLLDHALAAGLLSSTEPASFEALARRGDAEATLALALMHEFVCDELAPMTRRDGWQEELEELLLRRDDAMDQALSARDAEHFRGVSAALAKAVLDLAPRCAAVADQMAAAAARLERHANDGHGPALIALAYDSTHRREQLAGRLDELDADLLFEAIDVLHVKDTCEYRSLIEPIAARQVESNALFAGLLARIRDSRCDGTPATPAADLLPLYLRGALSGDLDSFERYRQLMQRLEPDRARIENFAIDLYQQRLVRRGCLGMEHFMLRQTLVERPGLAGGMHLSPYEFDAATERSERLWAEHARDAMRIRRCGD